MTFNYTNLSNVLKYNICKSIFLYVTILLTHMSYAQSVYQSRIREYWRNQALLQDSLAVSGMVNLPNELSAQSVKSVQSVQSVSSVFSLSPITITQQHQSALPYLWNQGSLVPAKGFQTMLAAGVRYQYKNKLSIELAPELVWAENKPFEIMSNTLGNRAWKDYYTAFYNVTDIPERFGNRVYTKLLPGQSAITYHGKQFDYAISTKNTWWGPGMFNALVLSNNAPGFLHAAITTNKPIQTKWGSLEASLIAGVLNASNVLPPRVNSTYEGQFVYIPKRNEDRYLTAMTLSWNPKWTPGFYLGFAKASYLYPSDIRSPIDALPLQGFFGEKLTQLEKQGKKASLGSWFMRYVMPKDHAEVYIEYGRKEQALMPWNLIENQPYRRAFVAGLRKLLMTSRKDAYWQLGVELTQMQVPDPDLIRTPDSWYTHQYVRQGYTHLGRSLGAGIGPGSNLQTIELNYWNKKNRLGVQFERWLHNADYYYYAFSYLGDFRRHWVTLATTFKADWDFGQFSLHGSLGIIRSLNHQWLVVQLDPQDLFAPGNEYLNVASQVTLRYKL